MARKKSKRRSPPKRATRRNARRIERKVVNTIVPRFPTLSLIPFVPLFTPQSARPQQRKVAQRIIPNTTHRKLSLLATRPRSTATQSQRLDTFDVLEPFEPQHIPATKRSPPPTPKKDKVRMCKERPKSNRKKAKGKGSGKSFVPWC